MSEPTEALAWVHRAEEDWLLACSAVRRKVPLIYGTTFHAQQCAEKYLKAVLVSRRHTFPRTHDLIALHDLCLGHGIRVPIDPDKLERLTLQRHLPISLFISIGYGIFMSSVLTVFIATTP